MSAEFTDIGSHAGPRVYSNEHTAIEYETESGGAMCVLDAALQCILVTLTLESIARKRIRHHMALFSLLLLFLVLELLHRIRCCKRKGSDRCSNGSTASRGGAKGALGRREAIELLQETEVKHCRHFSSKPLNGSSSRTLCKCPAPQPMRSHDIHAPFSASKRLRIGS